MADTHVKRENYITIQGWMRTDLNLKGNELIVYAAIYGFTQNEAQKFTGSLQYLADWCGATKQGIVKNLKTLVDNGLIQKEDKYVNGVKFVEYRTTELNGVLNSVKQGIKLSLPNNIENISIDNKELNIGKKRKSKETLCFIVDAFTSDTDLIQTINDFIEMRKEIKKPMTEKALTILLNKLKDLSTDEKTQIKILNQSIEHCWQSVYPLKGEEGKNGIKLKPENERDHLLDGIL